MRYPTTKSGLALPITAVGYEAVPYQRKLTNRHHLQFERNDYTSPLQRVFRGLLSRVVDMRIIDHQDLHEKFNAPRMPSNIVMIDTLEEYLAINGVIDVVREKRTWETYQVTSDQWLAIRDQRGLNGQQETHQRPVGLIGI